VVDALVGALRALPEAMKSPVPSAAWSGAWELYGIPGHLLEHAEYEKTKADLSERVAGLMHRKVA
jgi:hypothetical protein